MDDNDESERVESEDPEEKEVASVCKTRDGGDGLAGLSRGYIHRLWTP